MSGDRVQVELAPDEARILGSHLDRLNRWDPRGVVRVVTRPTAVGIYAAPPMGVMSFVALPLAGSPVSGVDATMTLSSARSALQGDVFVVEGEIASAPALSVLPPAEGWHLPIPGVSGDLLPKVEESIAEFRQRSPLVADTQVLADQLWNRPAFGGLPMRMLHAACRLGFLTDDGSRVTACTTSGWKRLTTVRGQIFVRTVPPGQRTLRVVP